MMLSFVIPCYRSQNTITSVVQEIEQKMQERPEMTFEIIAVNDGSPDQVLDVLQTLRKAYSGLRVVNLSQNFGQENARMAGLNYAQGDYAVCLDDDGQCPMDQLWHLIAPLEEGQCDVAIARYPKKKQSWFKNFGSAVNDKMTHWLLKMPANIQMSNFFAMNRMVYKEATKYQNPYPFITGLLVRTTQRITNVPMEERERLSGRTGYTFAKLLGLWLNGFTNFSVKPLRIADFVGLFCAVVGFCFGAVTIIRKIINPSQILSGYTTVVAAIFLIGGINMVLMGLIGEYIGRIFICLNRTPQFVVREVIEDEYKLKQMDEEPGRMNTVK